MLSSTRSRLARLRALSYEQRCVALISVTLLPVVEISLRVRGFKRTAASLAARSQRCAVDTPSLEARPVAEAVDLAAARSVIGTQCLGRSLVLWFLLRRRGIDAELVVGAEMPREGKLPAHAWVEVAGDPVNDVPDVRKRFGSFNVELPRLADTEQK